MISKKNLIRSLEKLVLLYESYEKSESESWSKEAFLSAYNMSKEILDSVEKENYGEAKYKWSLLERYSNDSLPMTGKFVSSYTPLKQSIINFGLQ